MILLTSGILPSARRFLDLSASCEGIPDCDDDRRKDERSLSCLLLAYATLLLADRSPLDIVFRGAKKPGAANAQLALLLL